MERTDAEARPIAEAPLRGHSALASLGVERPLVQGIGDTVMRQWEVDSMSEDQGGKDRSAGRRDGRKGRRRGTASGHGRMIGGRLYKRHEGEVEQARSGKWILVLVPEWCRDGWSSFKLFLDDPKAKKRVWHLAVKDGRVTGGAFITHLQRYHPKALTWASQKMKECR